MPIYQPGIPTGSVPLDQDYLNLQGNFQQLDIAYGVDHVPFSDTSGIPPMGISGMHKEVHLVPMATPAALSGYGQLFSNTSTDINTDTSLYWLTGGNRLIQLTGNFAPVANTNGYTMLPGGLILQWGLQTISPPANVTFPVMFPNNCFNVSATFQVNLNISSNSTIVIKSTTTTGFSWFINSAGSITKFYWMAIGN